MAAHPPDLLRIRPLESRMRGNLHVRFGGGRMEKDAAGSSKGRKNSDISRTSPAAYPTIRFFALGPKGLRLDDGRPEGGEGGELVVGEGERGGASAGEAAGEGGFGDLGDPGAGGGLAEPMA